MFPPAPEYNYDYDLPREPPPWGLGLVVFLGAILVGVTLIVGIFLTT